MPVEFYDLNITIFSKWNSSAMITPRRDWVADSWARAWSYRLWNNKTKLQVTDCITSVRIWYIYTCNCVCFIISASSSSFPWHRMIGGISQQKTSQNASRQRQKSFCDTCCIELTTVYRLQANVLLAISQKRSNFLLNFVAKNVWNLTINTVLVT